jgi:hypothetical protein
MTLMKDQVGIDGLTSAGGDGESDATKQSTTNMKIMGGQWEKNVETLGLKQISHQDNSLELFLNLRKLQLVDNCISKIDDLSKYKLLEEVSLEKKRSASLRTSSISSILRSSILEGIGLEESMSWHN